MNHTYMDSPLGSILLVGDEGGLRRINFVESEAPETPPVGSREAVAPFDRVCRQLAEYFRGERREFDLRLQPLGTAFQLSVWRALRGIPYGATCSYGDLARQLGRPTASRAVGAANGRNPLPIVIPCHRVIGAGGALTGYRGGVRIKEFLLRQEDSH